MNAGLHCCPERDIVNIEFHRQVLRILQIVRLSRLVHANPMQMGVTLTVHHLKPSCFISIRLPFIIPVFVTSFIIVLKFRAC